MARSPQIYAHRGASVAAPENTIPAFEQALAMGAAGIELDVYLSKDGRLVVIHDAMVDGTTSGHGRVVDFTAAELAALDAGSHHSEAYAGVGVPTLDDVLDLVGDRCVINIEIKNMSLSGGDQFGPICQTVRDRDLYDQVLVSSFNPISLLRTRLTDARIPLGMLYSNHAKFVRPWWVAPLTKPVALHPHYTLVDADYVEWAHRRGFRVNTWTVNETQDALRLADYGVDVIMTDLPDRIGAAFGAA